MFRSLLIANRGEIAVRVIRACRELGVSPVAVYSDADQDALHVRMADLAVRLGPPPAGESYLRMDRVLEAALSMGVDAIHPGYGFLSENAAFARECEAAGITFVGPSAEAMEAMGAKTEARKTMVAAGVPVVPGSTEPLDDPDAAAVLARSLGYPVLLKAAAGGGGRGMRLCAAEEAIEESLEAARREALAAFGDDTVYMEKAIVRPRHVEVQILADRTGHVVHLGERDCSVQRRHQKVIEETPCPSLDAATREAMGAAAVAAARAVGYEGAGTVEFLRDSSGSFYFLEMNTRIQVEHPITELVTGIDLVAWQLRVAAGEPLGFDQEAVVHQGHAIECRLYAEDPSRGWLPSPGRIHTLISPSGPGVREDSGVYEGFVIPSNYDALLSKICVWGEDRPAALARMARALADCRVSGVATNLGWLSGAIQHPELVSGDYDTGFEGRVGDLSPAPTPLIRDLMGLAAALECQRQEGEAKGSGASSGPVARSAWRTRPGQPWRSGGLL